MFKINLILVVLGLTNPAVSFGQASTVKRAPVTSAHGMYVGNLNDIWLADTFKQVGSKSAIYDSQGKVLKIAPTGVGLAGISKHPSLDIYSFCDLMGSNVFLVNRKGQKITTLSIPNPWNARWTQSAIAIYAVTYSGSVLRITNNGKNEEIISGLDAPFDIAPIGDDGIWVSEQGEEGDGRVCYYKKSQSSPEYEKIVCNKNISLKNPEGLWPLDSGAVAGVDTERGTLVKVSPDGIVTLLAEKLGIPILVQVLERGDWIVYTNQSDVGAALIMGNSPELLQ